MFEKTICNLIQKKRPYLSKEELELCETNLKEINALYLTGILSALENPECSIEQAIINVKKKMREDCDQKTLNKWEPHGLSPFLLLKYAQLFIWIEHYQFYTRLADLFPKNKKDRKFSWEKVLNTLDSFGDTQRLAFFSGLFDFDNVLSEDQIFLKMANLIEHIKEKTSQKIENILLVVDAQDGDGDLTFTMGIINTLKELGHKDFSLVIARSEERPIPIYILSYLQKNNITFNRVDSIVQIIFYDELRKTLVEASQLIFPSMLDYVSQDLLKMLKQTLPNTKILLVSEYDYCSRKTISLQEDTPLIKTGLSFNAKGIFIPEKKYDDEINFNDAKKYTSVIRALTRSKKEEEKIFEKWKVYKENIILYVGYLSDPDHRDELKTGDIVRFLKTQKFTKEQYVGLAIWLNKETKKNVDIILPITKKDVEKNKESITKTLSKCGFSKLIYGNQNEDIMIWEAEKDEDEGVRVMRILNLFPMSHDILMWLRANAETVEACRGDHSLPEAIFCFKEPKIPFYQISPWKAEYFKAWIERIDEISGFSHVLIRYFKRLLELQYPSYASTLENNNGDKFELLAEFILEHQTVLVKQLKLLAELLCKEYNLKNNLMEIFKKDLSSLELIEFLKNNSKKLHVELISSNQNHFKLNRFETIGMMPLFFNTKTVRTKCLELELTIHSNSEPLQIDFKKEDEENKKTINFSNNFSNEE